MNYLQNNIKSYWLLLMFAIIAFGQQSCKKDKVNTNPPQILKIRASTPAPNDSVLTAALPGQFVVIQGANLAAASDIKFNGFSASFNSGIFSETNLVVRVPNIAWDSIPAGKINTVEVTTPGGTATFKFVITAPFPSIDAISNENAVGGTTITLSGANFYNITKIVFPGGGVGTNLKVNSSTSVTVTVPAGITAGGPLQITGGYGTASSKIIFDNYLSPTVGFLANFEDANPYFGWQYWGGNKTADATLFPNNTGNYIQVHPTSSINAGDGSWYADNRAVMVAASAWVPAANLGDPIANYALKFEINTKEAWKKGSFIIAPNGNFNWLARYAPWETTGNGEFNTGNTWRTVVIPLTKFLSGNGSYNAAGSPAATIATLTGGTNAATIQIMLFNDATTALPSFNAAVDNVRIVKIN